MGRRPDDSKANPRAYYALFAIMLVSFVMMTGYASIRTVMLITGDGYSPADAVMAVLLLGAELFLCVHAVGYFFNMFKAGRRHLTVQPIAFARYVREPVAILVAAFNESERVLEDTLSSAAAMDYPINIYLLDDSTRPECQEGARRVAAKYGATLVHRENRAGYKAGAINDLIPRLTEKYIALLDADQKPREDWLKEVVAYMEDEPTLALVQAPQHYINDAGLPVCTAAKFQQAIFFEYICEGKSYSNAMFCCGSNCVLRREALLSIREVRDGRVNYFDESSVTEDFATAFLLHRQGWRSDYVNEKYALGMGPETLPAYFVQQFRWAMGTQSQWRMLLKAMWRTPRALTPAQWWEYWMVTTYYFVGFANFIFMLAPICFMLFGIKPVHSHATLYLAFFVPYVLFTMNLFFFGMRVRKYAMKGIWLASALSFSTFWIYMKAGFVSILGLKRAFGVTPKGVGGAIPLRRLWMELTMFVGNLATALWGIYHLIAGDGPAISYAINTVWATYHSILLSTLFLHFNRPVTIAERELLFQPARRAA
jgi:cellulose synthase (UDP-forming)